MFVAEQTLALPGSANHILNHGAVCTTAPVTPGLSTRYLPIDVSKLYVQEVIVHLAEHGVLAGPVVQQHRQHVLQAGGEESRPTVVFGVSST
mgnify:CR=1 FL=1